MTILFPGQGSQFMGMGEVLFAKFPALTAEAGHILGYSIAEVCLNGREKLMQTSYTQPAVFVVSALMYLDFQEQWNNPCIKYLMGHSLGEYTALYASGAFDFKTGVQLVKKRGELMQQVKNGAMAAVTGMTSDRVETILKAEGRDVHIANYNSATQVVIAGSADDISFLQQKFSAAAEVTYHILPVSGAFHSPSMSGAAEEFRAFLEDFSFTEPGLPVIANWNTMPYTLKELKENLVKQIDHPVLWESGIKKLTDAGATLFFEAGPRNVLSKLIKHTVLR